MGGSVTGFVLFVAIVSLVLIVFVVDVGAVGFLEISFVTAMGCPFHTVRRLSGLWKPTHSYLAPINAILELAIAFNSGKSLARLS